MVSPGAKVPSPILCRYAKLRVIRDRGCAWCHFRHRVTDAVRPRRALKIRKDMELRQWVKVRQALSTFPCTAIMYQHATSARTSAKQVYRLAPRYNWGISPVTGAVPSAVLGQMD